MEAYCIDLAVNSKIVPHDELEVLEYDTKALLEELKEWEVETVEELTDYDRCVFSSLESAEKFLDDYLNTYEKLGKTKICLDKNIPAMLYRRRNIVQTLMGYKMQTIRDYKKKWLPGQRFNLHDRTYFLTVELISIEDYDCPIRGACYQYNFKLP